MDASGGFLSLTGPATVVAAWLLTYLVHSTILLGGVWMVTSRGRLPEGLQDVLWKAALVGGLLTAGLQAVVGLHPRGSVEVGGGRVGTVASTSPDLLPHVVFAPSASLLPREGEGATTALPRGLPGSWPAILLAVWLGGAALSLGRFLFARARWRRMLRDRRPVRDGELPALLARLARESGIGRRVHLTCSPSIVTPVALGASEICVPPDALTELCPEQQACMLAHEVGHLARSDPAWLTLAGLLERAFFLQPLNRVGRRRLQEVSEYLADDWAVGLTGSTVTLARCLANVAGWTSASPRGVILPGMAEPGSPFVRRIQRMLAAAPRSSRPCGIRRHVLVAVGITGLLALFAPGVYAAGRTAPRPPVAARPSTGETPADPAVHAAVTDEPAGPSVPRRTPGFPPTVVPAAEEGSPWTSVASEAPPADSETRAPRSSLCRDLADRGARDTLPAPPYNLAWVRGDCRFGSRAAGEAGPSPDEVDLPSRSANGSFVLAQVRDGSAREREATTRAGEVPERSGSAEGNSRPFDVDRGVQHPGMRLPA